jgi:hypothetical protein
MICMIKHSAAKQLHSSPTNDGSVRRRDNDRVEQQDREVLLQKL